MGISGISGINATQTFLLPQHKTVGASEVKYWKISIKTDFHVRLVLRAELHPMKGHV